MRRTSKEYHAGAGISQRIYTDVNANCASDLFYIQAASYVNKKTEYRMARDCEAADFPYLYDFEYVVSGYGYIECDGKKMRMEPGCTYIINRLHKHRFYPDKEEPFQLICLNVAGIMMDNIFAMLGITQGVIFVADESNRKVFNGIINKLKAIDPNCEDKQKEYEEIAAVLFSLILAATRDTRQKNDKRNIAIQINEKAGTYMY